MSGKQINTLSTDIIMIERTLWENVFFRITTSNRIPV
jgi:hypothetical protein